MHNFLDQFISLFTGQMIDPWVYEVFIVVLLVLIASFIARRIFTNLARKAGKTVNPWDDALILSFRRPIVYSIMGVGILHAAYIVGERTEAVIFSSVSEIREVLIITMLAWALTSFVKNYEEAIVREKMKHNETFDRTSIHAVAKLVRTALIITTGLVILQTLGFSVSGVLAFGGVGGIALGFAARDLLANFFGGLMIYMDRPFSVGDWIRSPDKEIEGTVESIGWRLTRIRTFDKRPLYVPNSIFANISVENPSRMSHRRIYETIGLRYDDVTQMNNIVDEVRAMLIAHEEIDSNQTLIVNFDQFNESSLDFFIYTFTKTTEWVYFHEVKQDVLLKVSQIIEKHGAEIAFPTRTMIMTNDLLNQSLAQ